MKLANLRFKLVIGCLLMTLCSQQAAAQYAGNYPQASSSGSTRQTEPLDAAAMARQTAMVQRIDTLLASHRDKLSWESAPRATDPELMRRVYLDLTGSPPGGRDVLKFVETQSPNKFDALVDELLGSESNAAHLANIWASWLLPDENNDNPFIQQNLGLNQWLKERFEQNLRYDRLVADLLVATGSPERGPTGFFVALGGQPEKIAAKTARVFMGVQLDCAECHDHPFDDWSQQDFWGYAAYFAQISSPSPVPGMQQASGVQDLSEGEVTLPDTDEVVLPKPLVETGLSGIAAGTRRQQLTLWLTARENPFLARATVNRVWAQMFGQGLIEPIDDMRSIDMATHPELLSELSDYFQETGYDLRNLFATLAKTEAYQLSSRHASGDPPREAYATMVSKPLTEAQMAESIVQAARQVSGQQADALRNQFQRQVGQLRGDAGAAKLGIVNALVTLHGRVVDGVTREDTSRLLKALEAPFMTDEKRVRWLFLTTLCRPPTDAELEQVLAAVERSTAFAKRSRTDGETDADVRDTESDSVAWRSDLLWALLNSSEFAMTP